MKRLIRRKVVCLVAFVLTLVSCATAPKPPKAVKTVAFITNTTSDFWKIARKGCEKADTELPDVAAKIGLELRNQYVLGYSPKNAAKDGKYRKVEVKLVKIKELPPLRARYRPGYVAPAQ